MTSNAERLLLDVRALGPSAVIRAGYEVSKRLGLHSAMLRVPRGSASCHSSVLNLSNRIPQSDVARQRTIDDARSILAEGLRVFGTRVSTGAYEPWTTDPLTHRRWPDSTPWWKIDIRSSDRMGDVKYVWEAGRHRDLVVLARAAKLEPDGPWADELGQLLARWCDQTAPERGINWYSSLELSLRAIAWTQILALAGGRLSSPLRDQMDQHLLASARHLMVELPYTLTMKNNHVLGDALGLIVLARMFPNHRAAGRWNWVGDRLFSAQVSRHVGPDGSMIEDSLSYHRFVLEMLAVRVLLGDASHETRQSLKVASEHLRSIGVFDGKVPQYGDWDEGRVLASSGDASDVAGSTALGLALVGYPVHEQWLERYDELAWYAPEQSLPSQPLPPTRSVSRSGGIVHVNRGPWDVWFKVGGGPSHGHADLTSVWVQRSQRWLIEDPGTGTYNGSIDVRNGLRTSAAHPVLRIGGADQLGPHRAFRWLRTAHGHLAPPVQIGDGTILFGWHDAYSYIAADLRVARSVVLTDSYLVVIDQVSPEGAGLQTELTIPLAPGIAWHRDCLVSEGKTVPTFGLGDAEQYVGQQTPFLGWSSRTYGQREPSAWLAMTRKTCASAWGLGAVPDVTPSDNAFDVGGLRLNTVWQGSGAALEITETTSGLTTVLRA